MRKVCRGKGARQRRGPGVGLFGALAVAGLAVVAVGSGSAPSSGAASVPRRGGQLTVLQPIADEWATGLDPVTSATATISQSEMNAIYGELFELGPGGSTIYDLARGSSLTDGGKRFTIDLRPGVTFSDGTAFDATAVALSLKRDFSKGSPVARPAWQVSSIKTPNEHTVVINLSVPDGAILDQFQDSIVNWTTDPTALRKMGEQQYSNMPVGAGPFIVKSDSQPSSLVLTRNSRYWQKGHPYLNELVFETTPNDESALEDLRSGTAQAYEGMLTHSLVPAYEHAGFTVTTEPSSSPYDLQLNTRAVPFDNVDARRAIYEATDVAVLDRILFGDATQPVESFTTPGGLFYEKDVPGYPSYNLAKAKALVREVGGLSVQLTTVASAVDTQFAEALQTMWEQAGIKATIKVEDLTAVIEDSNSGKWQSILSTLGAYDPAAGVGLAFHFETPTSGVQDAHLDTLINAAQESASAKTRQRLYDEIAELLATDAYNPFLFPAPTWNVAAKGVEGPGLTTKLPTVQLSPSVLWEDVSRS